MPDSAPSPAIAGTSWAAVPIRAALALILGVAITLSPEHGATFGLIALAAFALPAGALGLASALRGADRGLPRALLLLHGGLTLAAGIAAAALIGTGVVPLMVVVVAWALATGVVEIALGALHRDRLSRDRIIVGGASVLLGLAVLLVPADLAQAVAGENGSAGVLTASVVVTGALGAWAVVAGVVLAIAAVTIRTPRAVTP